MEAGVMMRSARFGAGQWRQRMCAHRVSRNRRANRANTQALQGSNTLASVLRGTGNMLIPSVAICLGVILLVPLSPMLIFGFGPLPALGIAGGGVAVVITTALTAAL